MPISRPSPTTLEQRHAVRIVDRAQEVVDQAGDEHGLAGAAQPGHRQVDGRALRQVGEARRVGEPPRRLGDDRGHTRGRSVIGGGLARVLPREYRAFLRRNGSAASGNRLGATEQTFTIRLNRVINAEFA